MTGRDLCKSANPHVRPRLHERSLMFGDARAIHDMCFRTAEYLVPEVCQMFHSG